MPGFQEQKFPPSVLLASQGNGAKKKEQKMSEQEIERPQPQEGLDLQERVDFFLKLANQILNEKKDENDTAG